MPTPPAGSTATERDIAHYIVALSDVADECRLKLGAVKGLYDSWVSAGGNGTGASN